MTTMRKVLLLMTALTTLAGSAGANPLLEAVRTQ